MSELLEAIKFAEQFPLPRCEHGNALRDYADENLEPPCGCRFEGGRPLKQVEETLMNFDDHALIRIQNRPPDWHGRPVVMLDVWERDGLCDKVRNLQSTVDALRAELAEKEAEIQRLRGDMGPALS